MSKRGTILIVDDEPDVREVLPDVREVLKEYLGAQGYSTLAAADAAAARTLCAKHPIDLALLDIHMPGGDGLSLARYLREH